jgi:hypothetical protein
MGVLAKHFQGEHTPSTLKLYVAFIRTLSTVDDCRRSPLTYQYETELALDSFDDFAPPIAPLLICKKGFDFALE